MTTRLVRTGVCCWLAGVAAAATNFVSTTGSQLPPFDTWARAASNLQVAIDAAVDGDLVLVTNGTYSPLAELSNTTARITIRSMNGAAVTVLNGSKAHRVIRLSSDSVIDGFTITNGYTADFSSGGGSGVQVQRGAVSNCIVAGNLADAIAGGIIISSGGVVDNCIVRGNVASNAGGGVIISGGGILRRSTLTGNSVPMAGPQSNLFFGGGGILMVGGIVEECIVSNNTTANQGGGVYIWGAGSTERCTIQDNRAELGGGGVFCNNGGFVQSCIVRANASTNGGGVYVLTNGLVQNCTVIDNSATNGGGVYCDSGGSNVDSIVYYNSAVSGSNHFTSGATARYLFCATMPGLSGAPDAGGNRTNDPEFISYAGGNYRLTNMSVYVNAGTNMAGIFLLRERDGKPRVANGTVDYGAYEIGPVAPFLDVTTTPSIVNYDTTAATVAGTNTSLVAGGLLVSNAWNGFMTNVPASLSWAVQNVPMDAGTNVIIAYGTNIDRFVVADSVTVVRLGPGTGTPKVAITNGGVFVEYDMPFFVVTGTNNMHVVGDLWIEMVNAATSTVSSFTSLTGWFGRQVTLAVGTNTVTVSGTNVYGDVASNTTPIVRGGPGTSAPYLDVTTTPATVNYDVRSILVAGLNNIHVMGDMWVSNNLNGAVSNFPAASAWTSPALPLDVGTNLLVVYGTNVFGTVTNDSVEVIRGAAGTGMPFVNITSAVVSVSFYVTSLQVAGTNNECVVGGMRVYNPTTGDSFNFPASRNWTAPAVNLFVGFNDIYVEGTNAYGVPTYDLLVVARNSLGMGTPALDITSAPATVTYDVSSYAVAGTNNDNVIGYMSVSNAANGSEVSFPALPAWVSAPVALAVGSNQLTALGANATGSSVTDTVTVVRGVAGTGLPQVALTNVPASVVYDVADYAFAGTNNANVIGNMWVSNSLNGQVRVVAAASPWTAPPLPLAVGANTICAYGTNLAGIVATNVRTVTRLNPGTGVPMVDITTTPVTVTIDITNREVAGTNNANVVGSMWVSNAANGYAVMFSAAASWRTNVPLAVDLNDIFVFGTNVYGEASTDTVTVTRGSPGTGVPEVDISSTNAFVIFDTDQFRVLGSNNRNVMGGMWISNALNGVVSNFPAAATWTSTWVALDVGTNSLAVYGTNLTDQVTNDTIAVIRGPAGTGLPYLSITTDAATVSYAMSSQSVAGVANANIIGSMWVSNAANGSVQSFPAAQGWVTPPVLLEPYDNALCVYGTNLYGQQDNDSITLMRSPPAGVTNFVSLAGSHQWPFTSRATAATNIAAAVRAAVDGNLVLVDTGTFTLSSRIDVTRDITVRGVAGAENTAILMSGLATARCFWLSNGVLDGLAITNETVSVTTIVLSNGYSITNTYVDWWGGGVYLHRGGELRNCIVAGNGSTNHGGGIHCYYGGTATNCIIAGNSASWNGGGIYGNNGGTVLDSMISANTATNGGGAFLIISGTVTRCIVYGNKAHKNGGAAYLQTGGMVDNAVLRGNWAEYGAAVFSSGGAALNCRIQRNDARYRGAVYFYYGGLARNCEISGNTADYGGGIFFEAGGSAESCTIAGNEATTSCGGTYCLNGGACVNCIICDNFGGETGTTNYFNLGTNIRYTYCATMPALPGDVNGGGNLAMDPGFVDPAVDDYHTLVGSPCIDTGTNMDWMAASTDLDGVDRIIGTNVNIGCYELARSGATPAPSIIEPMAVAPGSYGVYYTTNLLLSSIRIAGAKATDTWVVIQDAFDRWITNGIAQSVGATGASAAWSNQPAVSVNGRNTILTYRGANTNLLELSTNATMIEIRYAGLPATDITSAPADVTYDTASIAVAGTNNAYVVGGMWLSNHLSGAVTSFPAAAQWTTPEMGLDVGFNTLVVYATNRFGAGATDTVVVTRYAPGTGFPFVDVLDTNTTVTFDAATASPAGTNNVNVVGGMWVSNAANAAVASFASTQAWTAAAVPLAVGTNVLHVCGTNVYGYVTNDTVRIVRGVPGTGRPFVAATNRPGFVTFDATTFVAAGTNNPNVLGSMWVSNAANGARASFTALPAWAAPALAIVVGSNVVAVYGSNLFGAVTNDVVVVVRGQPGTGMPVVDVTNNPAWVTFDATTYAVAGINNTNVVGGMWVSNAANAAVAQLAASASWTTPGVPLNVGPNEIWVRGTNAFGAVADDSVVITRGAPGTGIPYLSITSQTFTVQYSVTNYVVAGTNNPNVVGGMWVSNTANGMVRAFAADAGWSASIPLTPPPFIATLAVCGTNAFGVVATDAITVRHARPAGVTNHVALTGGNKWPYVSWGDAATDIQSAIDAAEPSNTVLVFDGTYTIVAPLAITNTITVKSAHGAEATMIRAATATHRCAHMSDGVLEGFTLSGGYAMNGGAVHLASGGTVAACVLEDNSAAKGGAAWLDYGGTLQNCIVRNNSATETSALWLDHGGTVRSSVVHANTGNDRGTIECLQGGVVQNCTVVSNFSIAVAGVMCDQGGLVQNSILYHNNAFSGATNYYNVGAGMSYDRNCLSPAIAGLADGGGNVTNDPRLLDLASGDPRFDVSSPCRDAGTNMPWMASATDVNGMTRIVNDIVDIGAFEHQGSNALVQVTNDPAWVSFDVLTYAVAGTNNVYVVGGMWVSNAANGAVARFAATPQWVTPTLPLAVGPNPFVACGTNVYGQVASDTVVITRGAPGTGVPYLSITNQAFTVPYDTLAYAVAGTNNPNVVGDMWVSNTANGFVAAFAAGLSWTTSVTLTPPPLAATLVVYGSNAFGVTVSDAVSVSLSRPAGVTNHVSLTGGNKWPFLSWADAATDIQTAIDAAEPSNTVLVFDGTYTLGAPLVITNDIAVKSAHGADVTFVRPATPTHRCAYLNNGVLEGFTLSAGFATNGGAVHLDMGGTVAASVLEGNNAMKGGAAWLDHGGTLQGCVVRLNAATETSALWLDHGGIARSCLVFANTGNDRGAVECLLGGVVQNCTVVSNVNISSGGVVCDQGGLVQNSILYHNNAFSGSTNYHNIGAGMSYDHNCLSPEVSGLANGGDNITNDPGLVGIAAGDAAFLITSPCRDAGVNLPWMAGATDVKGMQRVCNAVVDIGAFEFQGSNAVVGISNMPVWVSFDVLTYALGGSNNVYVVGGMWMSNEANGAVTAFSPVQDRWTTPPVPLAVGANTLAVYGTNIFGQPAKDTVVITRGGPGTGAPYVDITNQVFTAPHDATNFTVAGTNNPNIVGNMWVSNAANGAVSVFPASASWSASVSVAPPLPETTLAVYGTNAFGVLAADSVVLSLIRPVGVTNYVALTGGHIWPYLSWGAAATNIQSAIDAASPLNMVLVYDGTYPISGELRVAKDITVISAHGKESTMIVPLAATHRCVTLSAGVMDGFTLSNGYATSGGAVCFNGGGTLRRCALVGNRAYKGGAAWFVSGGMLENCFVRNNSAAETSALWFDQGGSARNCAVSANKANDRGAVECLMGGVVQNCTIVSNDSLALHGIICDQGGLIQNSIVYYNAPGADATNHYDLGAGMHYEHCCTYPAITDPTIGTGNFVNAPRILDMASGNPTLMVGSPCRDTGTNLPWMAGSGDFFGAPRIANGIVDVGAFEYQSIGVCTAKLCKVAKRSFSATLEPFTGMTTNQLSKKKPHYVHVRMGDVAEGPLGQVWRIESDNLWWILAPSKALDIDPLTGITIPVVSAAASINSTNQKFSVKYIAKTRRLLIKGSTSSKSGLDYRNLIGHPFDTIRIVVVIDDVGKEVVIPLDKKGSYKQPRP